MTSAPTCLFLPMCYRFIPSSLTEVLHRAAVRVSLPGLLEDVRGVGAGGHAGSVPVLPGHIAGEAVLRLRRERLGL